MSKQELLEKLRLEEETILLDLLNVTSEELVDAFMEKIIDRYEYIHGQYEPQK